MNLTFKKWTEKRAENKFGDAIYLRQTCVFSTKEFEKETEN